MITWERKQMQSHFCLDCETKPGFRLWGRWVYQGAGLFLTRRKVTHCQGSQLKGSGWRTNWNQEVPWQHLQEQTNELWVFFTSWQGHKLQGLSMLSECTQNYLLNEHTLCESQANGQNRYSMGSGHCRVRKANSKRGDLQFGKTACTPLPLMTWGRRIFCTNTIAGHMQKDQDLVKGNIQLVPTLQANIQNSCVRFLIGP